MSFRTNAALFTVLIGVVLLSLVVWLGIGTKYVRLLPGIYTPFSTGNARKVILLTTRQYARVSTFGGLEKAKKLCPRCEVTQNLARWDESDAVLFNGRFLSHLVPPKTPGQIWIYYYNDSPDRDDEPVYRNLHLYRRMFNWTMTYRRDSDLFTPYAEFVEDVAEQDFDTDAALQKFSNKSGLITWIASNCRTAKSGRSQLVHGLSLHVPVDIYGDCGTQKCPTNRTASVSFGADCRLHLSRTYKFYLAFENSLCEDYVTEKFFDVYLTDMVPIVYGAANYTALGAPADSYINVADFENVETLANHVKWLDANPDEYVKYLKARSGFSVRSKAEIFWCKICDKLFDQGSMSRTHVYEDLREWWRKTADGRPMCVSPPSIVFQN